MIDILTTVIQTAAAALLLGVFFCMIVFVCERIEKMYRRHKRRIFWSRMRRIERNRELRRRGEVFQYELIRRTWLLEDELVEVSKPKQSVTLRGVFDVDEGKSYMDKVMERSRF